MAEAPADSLLRVYIFADIVKLETSAAVLAGASRQPKHLYIMVNGVATTTAIAEKRGLTKGCAAPFWRSI